LTSTYDIIKNEGKPEEDRVQSCQNGKGNSTKRKGNFTKRHDLDLHYVLRVSFLRIYEQRKTKNPHE